MLTRYSRRHTGLAASPVTLFVIIVISVLTWICIAIAAAFGVGSEVTAMAGVICCLLVALVFTLSLGWEDVR